MRDCSKLRLLCGDGALRPVSPVDDGSLGEILQEGLLGIRLQLDDGEGLRLRLLWFLLVGGAYAKGMILTFSVPSFGERASIT